MKVVTWNVNGIRSLKKSIAGVLSELESDVTCFQETKITRNLLSEDIAFVDGYTSYFSYPRKQSGYSGVASYCIDSYVPEDAEEGLSGLMQGQKSNLSEEFLSDFEDSSFSLIDLDSEGRVIVTYHLIKHEDEIRRLAVINVYCPRVDPEKPERHLFKMQFCRLLEAKTVDLCKKNCHVMIVGDMNICHSMIDHCDACDEEEFYSSEARQWFGLFVSSKKDCNDEIAIADAFRHFYPDKKDAYTCWNVRTGARSTNYGTRIDYVLISSKLLPLLLNCEILSDYHGSDHCPVKAEFKFDPVSMEKVKLPSICTRLWPEFSGRQQKLQFFLQKGHSSSGMNNNLEVSNANISLVNKKKKNAQKSIMSFFKSSTPIDPNNSSLIGISKQTLSNGSAEYIKVNNSSDKEVNGKELDEPVSKMLCVENSEHEEINSSLQAKEWKSLLKGPPKPPMCTGHNKACVLRTVKKKGPNYGRQFFMCPQPAGHSTNPEANCNFFKWASAPKINTLK